jgi:hypothetical protein
MFAGKSHFEINRHIFARNTSDLMPRVSLAALAKENETTLHARYEELMRVWAATGSHGVLAQFHDHCQPNWCVSMNCDWRGLSHFLTHGEPYNMYRFNREAGEPVDLPASLQVEGASPINWAYFEQKLSPEWAARRRKFNEYAHLEEEFTYGAYYLQGPGLERYGKQMVVLKRTFLEGAGKTSYLMADSLQWYVAQETETSPAQVLEIALHDDLATFETVSKLLCIKMADELQELGHQSCLEAVTRDTYIEAQIPEKIGLDAIDRVRIRSLMEEELEFYAEFLTQPNVLKNEEHDTQHKKNAYYYMLFSLEFPRQGVKLEEF